MSVSSIESSDSEHETQRGIDYPDVVDKYKAAADIVNGVLAKIIKACVPGRAIIDLCAESDGLIEEAVKGVYNKARPGEEKVTKGVAFPTCISVNNVAGNYSPLSSDEPRVVLAEGDVIKIDMGAHIDGYASTAAHTVVCSTDTSKPTEGKAADVTCAAYFAAEAALRMLRPGVTNYDVSDVIGRIAEAYKCVPVEGVLSHETKRFIIAGHRTIMNKPTVDQKVEEFEFEEYSVFSIDVMMSTGEGKPKEKDQRTTVFQRDLDRQYSLKMKASRQFFGEMTQRFQYFPFSLRAFKDERSARLGVAECLKHELVTPMPVLFEKDGEIIAQFKFTGLIMPSNTHRITTVTEPPFVKSELQIEDEEIKAILARSTKRKKKKGKKAEAKAKVEGESSK